MGGEGDQGVGRMSHRRLLELGRVGRSWKDRSGDWRRKSEIGIMEGVYFLEINRSEL